MQTVVGHAKNKNYFEAVLKNGRFSHAYLFTGPAMTGKKLFAENLFKKANGRDTAENNPDFKLIFPRVLEGETKIYIDDIRDIKSFLSLKPYYGPYKFVVIDNADRMTDDASNALLKTLEEPAPHSIIILVTANPKLLLPTISSRCETIKFLPQKETEMADFIKQNNYKIKEEDLLFLLKLARGRIGWLIGELKAGRLTETRKNIDDFQKIIGQGIFEKMQFAKKTYENDGYAELAGEWLNWAYSSDAGGTRILKGLLQLNRLFSQPQSNHRLALENFLISI